MKKRKGRDTQNSMQQSSTEQSSSMGNDILDLIFLSRRICSLENEFCRKLTSIDVDQALHPLTIDQQRFPSIRKTEQCECCRLIRTLSSSPARLLLPLARRGRPHASNQSARLLCSNCNEIKQQLQMDILKTEQTRRSNNVTLTDNSKHLTDQQKKLLLEEMIRKLQIVLNNHPTIDYYNDENFQLTYRTLQTTLSLLSSSSHDRI